MIIETVKVFPDGTQKTVFEDVPDNWLPTLQEVTAEKISELSLKCGTIIYDGIDAETSKGIRHFGLKEGYFESKQYHDQTNISAWGAEAKASPPEALFPYHADGKDCGLFTRDDVLLIAKTASEHIVKNTTYLNLLNRYVKLLDNADAISAIQYGMPLEMLPDARYQERFMWLLTSSVQGAEHADFFTD